MKRLERVLIFGSLLGSVHCSASAIDAPADSLLPVNTQHNTSGRIAFVTELPNRGGFLYIANADGSNLRQLPVGQAYYSRPRWSPDGRRIVVSRSHPDLLDNGIFVIDVDAPQPTLVRLASGHHPAWSPDGTEIAFSSSGTRSWPDIGIHIMGADGRNIRRLTYANDPTRCSEGSSASDLKPDWSPDGRRIVFERDIHTSDVGFDCGLDGWGYVPNVYVMNADGTALRLLPSTGQSDSDPVWSPDGRFIAYATIRDGLYVIDSEAAGPPKRVDFRNLSIGIPLSPTWSPDEKKLLFLAANPPNNNLAVVDIGSGVVEVLRFPTVTGLLLDPAWSR